MSSPSESPWKELLKEIVVIDMESPFVFVGTMTDVQAGFIVLEDADAHDLRDTSTSREKYIINCCQFGVAPNRRKVWVNLRDIVGISRLCDIHLP